MNVEDEINVQCKHNGFEENLVLNINIYIMMVFGFIFVD